MSDLIKNSLIWRMCAAIGLWFGRCPFGRLFAFLGRLWRESATYQLCARILKAKPIAKDSVYGKRLNRINQGLHRLGTGLREALQGSALRRAYGAILRYFQSSFLIGKLLEGGFTSILLIIIAAYTPIDYFLRDGLQIEAIAGIWDEALMIVCLIWIVYQRMTSTKPLQGRANSMDVYLGFYMIAGLALLTFCYTPHYFGVNLTGYRAAMQYILLFFIVSRLIRNDDDFMLMYKVMIAIAFLFALHGIYQFVVGVEIPAEWTDKAEDAVRTRVFSIFSNPNIMGAYMLLFAPMAIGMAYATDDTATKVFYWFCGICMCLGCLFTMSRGAWLALAIAAVLFALIVDRRLFGLMVVAGIAACFLPFVRSRITYLFTPEFQESNARAGRGKRWETAFTYLDEYERWDVGLGYGMFGGAVAAQNEINENFDYMYVDNYYVKLIVENGIAGLCAFLTSIVGLLWNGIRACGRNSKNSYKPLCAGMLAGLVGILVHSFFESLWEEPYMMALFFAIVGMLIYAGFFRKRAKRS
ncbi:MAG: hypothetical protein E7434_03805 [Ruminococcaceae bacterium]|nr:hypothetical protein [Oscillospiraceae bacterium]